MWSNVTIYPDTDFMKYFLNSHVLMFTETTIYSWNTILDQLDSVLKRNHYTGINSEVNENSCSDETTSEYKTTQLQKFI